MHLLRKILLPYFTMTALIASIFIPVATVSAMVDTLDDSISMTLESPNLYLRPLYPIDVDEFSEFEADDTFFTSEIITANESSRPDLLDGDFYYSEFEVIPDLTGTYTFTVGSETLNYSGNGSETDDRDHDVMFWLYQNAFDPADPIENVLAVNDTGINHSGDFGMYPELAYALSSGTTYILVVTTYHPSTTGSLTINMAAPANDDPPLQDDPTEDEEQPQQDDPPAEDDPPQQDEPIIDEEPQPEDPPVEEEPTIQDDQSVESLVEQPSSVPSSAKRDPITILHSATGVRTEDLSYFAAIPEQWMADVTYVEFWLDAVAVEEDPDQQAAVTAAAAALNTAGRTLYGTQTISLISRVTWRDRTQVTSVIDPDYIRANIPILLPVPDELLDSTGLGIVCIDSNGAVALLASEPVLIQGVPYLRFENNNLPAMYGFID